MGVSADAAGKGGSRFLNGTLVKMTAWLVAIAALINAGVDLFNTVGNVPIGKSERVNEELFRRHMGKRPIVDQPVTIKTSNATVEMLLQVYDSGDLFIRYGDFHQWLPFRPLKTTTGLSPFPEAYAQTSAPLPRAPVQKAGGVASPSIVIDIEKLKQLRTDELVRQQKTIPPLIERSYPLAAVKDDHPSPFSRSSRTYTETFRAEPGYKITKHEVEVAGANNYKLELVELVDNDTAVRVSFVLTSGPATDRWRGWVQGTVKTLQKRAP